MALTERKIRDAKPGQKTRIEWDSQVKGLGLRVTPAGAKAFVLNYRVDGRERRATIGRPGELSLVDAREKAGSELAAIKAGKADPLARRETRQALPTVAEGLDRFFDEFVPHRIAQGRMKESTVAVYRGQAAKHLRPTLGNMKVRDVQRADVDAMVRHLAPVARNRVLAFTSRVFTCFEAWDWRDQNANPAKRIERSVENPRDRVLTPSELAALSDALDAASERRPLQVAAIRMAALTGLRIGEVLGIRWQDVCFETNRLTLPETKTGRRVHDLPTAAMELLADVPNVEGHDWVFGPTPAKPSYWYVRDCFAAILKDAGLEGVRLHDLRRTVMTHAAAAGVSTHVLRDLLGHKTTAMADRYIRSVPTAAARESVGAAIAAMMAGNSGDVVPLKK